MSTGNTTTAIGADNLREMKYSLKAQYLNDPTLAWVWSHRLVDWVRLSVWGWLP